MQNTTHSTKGITMSKTNRRLPKLSTTAKIFIGTFLFFLIGRALRP